MPKKAHLKAVANQKPRQYRSDEESLRLLGIMSLLRDMHQRRKHSPNCNECGHRWPCATFHLVSLEAEAVSKRFTDTEFAEPS